MKYRSGYKYQLAEDESEQTQIKGFNIDTEFIRLTPDGLLTGKKGYAWDGASGPTWDSLYCMRGPLFHDIIYQLMRMGLIPLTWKPYADGLMYLLIMKSGKKYIEEKYKDSWDITKKVIFMAMERRALLWYNGVWYFGKSSTLPENDRPILEAP